MVSVPNRRSLHIVVPRRRFPWLLQVHAAKSHPDPDFSLRIAYKENPFQIGLQKEFF